MATQFIGKYSLENIFVFADSTDPNFYDLKDCINDNKLTGKGYITEIIRFFKEDYQHDNVITNPNKDLKVQVLSNIWD